MLVNDGSPYEKPSSLRTGTKTLLLVTLAAVVCCLLAAPTHAQGSLQLGTMQVNNFQNVICNPADGWYAYTFGGGQVNLNCKTATISCPNSQNISLLFGWLDPSVIGVVSKPLGTIVLFSGDGGIAPGNSGYADGYFKAGYEIVQVAWATDWEQTYDPFVGSELASIQNAACRPATFLNYVFTSVFPAVQAESQLGSAAFCAHGASAGSAQIAYSLAFYGAGKWLDNVELLAGPVFSDVEQGCEVPAPTQNVTICPAGQTGCRLGTDSPWQQSPSYVGVQGSVGQWTNDSTCRNAPNGMTSPASNNAWLAQSIVDAGAMPPPPAPTFSYPNTGMSAWLCTPALASGTSNNSSPEGQLFYYQVSNNSFLPPNYAIYSVDNCAGAEGVGGGYVSGFQIANENGSNAITYDMVGYKVNNVQIVQPQCVLRH